MTDHPSGENVMILAVKDIYEYAASSGGEFPKEWIVGKATFKAILTHMREAMKNLGNWPKHPNGILMEDDEIKEFMLIGVIVRPMRGTFE